MKNLVTTITLLLASLSAYAQGATYPMTQTYDRNPLFVNFPSPLYNQSGTGPFYSADPSARVWNFGGKEVLYVYCSHDIEPARGCDRMDRYHVFSTEDLKTWTDHGEIINSKQVNEKFGDTQEGFMWAPDCVYNSKNQTYYFVFPHATNFSKGEWKIYVATSKDPATGFELKNIIDGAASAIDPMVFIDNNGKAYLYVGGGGHLYGGELDPNDWSKLKDGTMTELTGAEDFHEGAWVFKYGGVYYLTYPDNAGSGGNRMRYATSNNPLGPWHYKGIYMYPHGEETAHGSVVQFKGQWYQFYHTGNYSGEGTLRSVCFDPLTINADGSLAMVRNWGEPWGGTAPSVSLSQPILIEAEHYNTGGSHYGYYKHVANGDIKTITSGGATYIESLRRKEWVHYSFNATEEGPYAVTVRVKPNHAGSKFSVEIDGSRVRPNVAIPGNVGEWTTVTLDNIYILPGEHFLGIRGGDSSTDFAIDWIKMEQGYTRIPGRVEAEDFDRGGEGVAYHWQNETATGRGYRDDAIFVGGGGTGHNLGWTTGGDWAEYTVDITKTGTYTLHSNVSSGISNGGSFHVTLDGKDITGTIKVPNTGWDTYKVVDTKNINIPELGLHKLRFCTDGGMNIDYMEWECTHVVSTGIEQPASAIDETATVYYDLQGRRVAHPSHGIYISNGKKMIVD